MRAALVLLLALTGLAVVAALWLGGSQGTVTPAAPPTSVGAADEPEDLAEPAALLDRRKATAPEAPPRAAPAPPIAAFPASLESAALEIVVVDAEWEPVPRAVGLLRSHTGPRPRLYALSDGRGIERELTVDDDGRARFEALPSGPYEVTAASPDGELRGSRRFLLEAPATRIRLQIVAGGGGGELVVTVRGARGETVSGARVEITGGVGDLRANRDEGAPLLAAVADAEGRARFQDSGFGGLVAVAEAPDGRLGSTTAWTRQNVVRAVSRGLEVVVGDPAQLAGSLAGVAPEQLAGARVHARLLNNSFPHYTTHGRSFEAPVVDGRYAFDDLAPGVYTLALEDPGGARLVLPGLGGWGAKLENSVDPIEVELAPGAEAVQDLEVTAGAVLEGVVRDERGAPLAGATVRATYAPRTSNFPDGFVLRGVNVWRYDSRSSAGDEHPETHRLTTTDAGGSYRLAGLQPGRQRVEVALSGRTYDRREEVGVRDGETTRLDHELVPAGAIGGIARDGGYLGVIRADEDAARMIAILPSERLFCFPGLEPGAWVVAKFHSDERVDPVPVATVTVEAGRTTWIDVDAEGELPIRIAGRILDGAGPVPDVTVVAYPRRLTTNAAGRFEFRTAFPWTGSVSLTVERERIATRFQFPGMPEGTREWERDVLLGDSSLTVRAVTVDGAPSTAVLSIGIDALERPEIEGIRGDGLEVGTAGRTFHGLPAGSCGVNARFPDGGETHAQLALPSTEPLVLQAPAVASLTVLVLDADNQPVPRRSVNVATWVGEGPAPEDEAAFREHVVWSGGATGDDGQVLIEGVHVGEVRVQLSQETRFLEQPKPTPPPERVTLTRGAHATVVLRD